MVVTGAEDKSASTAWTLLDRARSYSPLSTLVTANMSVKRIADDDAAALAILGVGYGVGEVMRRKRAR